MGLVNKPKLEAFTFGEMYFDNTQYKKAIKKFKKIISNKNNKNYHHANYLCGASYLYLNQPVKALKYFEVALDIKNKAVDLSFLKILPEVYARQGLAYLLMGSAYYQNAEQSFKESSHPLSFFHRGILKLLKDNDKVGAEEDLNKALKEKCVEIQHAAAIFCELINNQKSPLYEDAKTINSYLQYMGCLKTNQDHTKTKSMSTASVNATASTLNLEELFDKADSIFNTFEYFDSIPYYESFIDNFGHGTFPTWDDNTKKYKYWDAHYACACAFLYDNNPIKALPYLNKLVDDMGQKSQIIKDILPDVYERRGLALLLLGKACYSDAEESLNKSRSLSSNVLFKNTRARSLFHSSIIKFLSNDDAKAQQDIRQALALNKVVVESAAYGFVAKINSPDSALHSDLYKIRLFLDNNSISYPREEIPSSLEANNTGRLSKLSNWFATNAKKVNKEKELLNIEPMTNIIDQSIYEF
jgi:hypothetical protein